MLGLRVAGIHLEHPAQAGMNFPPAVHRPGQRRTLRPAQAGMFHHILGGLIDDIRIIFICGKDPHLGPVLPVIEQVIQPQPGGKFALTVLLGQLIVKKPAISHPPPVRILDPHPIKEPNGLFFPREQLKGPARPLVLSKAQQAKEIPHILNGLLIEPQHAPIPRLRHSHARRQLHLFRQAHTASQFHLFRHVPSAPSAESPGDFPPSEPPPAAPTGTGW